MTPRSLLTLAGVVGLMTAVTAADWPQWRGPDRDGKSADTNLANEWPTDGPKLLWSVDDVETMGVGYGDPSIVGDRAVHSRRDQPEDGRPGVLRLPEYGRR